MKRKIAVVPIAAIAEGAPGSPRFCASAVWSTDLDFGMKHVLQLQATVQIAWKPKLPATRKALQALLFVRCFDKLILLGETLWGIGFCGSEFGNQGVGHAP